LASAAGLAEGPGLTRWVVPVPLEEDATYYWSARASDGRDFSPWSLPVPFTVHMIDAAPSAPTPVSPVGGVAVATVRPTLVFVNLFNDPPGVPTLLDPDGTTVSTATPTLRLRNTTDADGDALSYEFEVKDAAGQVVASMAGVPSGVDETMWNVTAALAEDATL